MKNHIMSNRKNDGLAQFLVCLLIAIPILFLPVMLAFHTPSQTGQYLLWLCSGWLSWTFLEYMAHRFWMHHSIYHMNNQVYESHMHHHKHPTDIRITDRQRTGLLTISMVLFYLSFVFQNAFTFVVGFYNGFLLYTLMHVVLHKRWAAKVFPKLQEMHIHHHGKFPDRCYSFSTTLWDRIYGTMAPKGALITPQFRQFYFHAEPRHHKEENGPKTSKKKYLG